MMHANIASEQYVQDLADLQDFQNWVKRRGDVGDVLSAIRFQREWRTSAMHVAALELAKG